MSGEQDKIYADASQPATLIDGKSVATIKVKDRVFTASEIDRLHHRKTRPA
jgi:hypothetical protein